ncbi:MAG: hypothetical protein CVU47_05735 [Chloroflexi bacterium HGW-Chloroflexi-9]|nr:MAG: hypothetical protein CVU47_05735 [Chloroflexi bacterium HGW-Chloroflexi-9]
MVNEDRCEELRAALSAVRARIALLDKDSAVGGALGAVSVRPSAIEASDSSDIEQEIRSLEQALRDEGCEVS